jgi:hypothetical protein
VRSILLALLALLAASLASAAPWLERASAVAVCAAGVVDLASTNYALARGYREANPIFGDHGRERWGAAIAFKASVCAGDLVLTWRRRSRAVAATNYGLAAGWGALSVWNWRRPKP